MPELEELGIVEGGEGGGLLVGGIGSVAEDLEEGEVVAVVGGGGEGLDLRGREELGEDEGVWGRGGADYEVCGGAGGGGRFCEG